LAQAVPEKITAASNGATTAIIFGGTKSLTGQDFVYVEALGGGMGASSKKDGMDGIQVHITNTSNLPVESMELEYPLRVLRYGLVSDSGGPGRRRGGLAIRKDIMALKPMRFSTHSDRHKISPWGLEGGHPGSKGHFLLKRHKRKKKSLPSKVVDLVLHKNDILKIQTAGGGGYGPPEKREPEKIVNDLQRGRISHNRAKKIYKVIWKKNGLPDPEALASLRSRSSKE
jgi:N-methylhydantoinase B